MPEETLNKLKEFESLLKKCLQDRFGSALPENKISLLNNTNFIDIEKLQGLSTREEIQGEILRSMLGKTISMTTTKELHVSDSEIQTIQYGDTLERLLIEGYAYDIAQKYHFDINEIPELKEKIRLLALLKERLGEGLDEKVLNSDAVELLSIEGLEEISKNYDQEAIDKYLEKNAKAASLDKDDIKELNDSVEENVDEKNCMKIVEDNGKKYIEYVDDKGEVHLIDFTDNDKIIMHYQKRLSELGPDEKIDVNKLFQELLEIKDEEKLEFPDTEQRGLEENTDSISNDQINMLNFIHATRQSIPLAAASLGVAVANQGENTLPSLDEINELPQLNDANNMTDVDKTSNIENTDSIPDHDVHLTSDSVLTPEQYEELCMKYARNEELSVAEYNALLKSTPDMMDEQQQQELLESERQQDGPKLTMNSKRKSYYGFTNDYMIGYIILITVIIGLIFGALLFTITN